MNIVRAVQSFRHPPLRDILTDFEGVVRPGEMLRMFPVPYLSLCITLISTLQSSSDVQAQVAQLFSKLSQIAGPNITP
jgi:ATP-binding cassette subfamily G (WHITE) protein 2 (SNQ2)